MPPAHRGVPRDAAGGGRVWLAAPDVRALSTVEQPFRVVTGWTVEVADPWGDVVGFTDHTTMPERGRPAAP
jgi:hypothetical protein